MNGHDDEKLYNLLKEYEELPEYSEMEIPSINTKSLFGNYPINIAASRGLMEEVTLLLSYGADVNVHGEHGYTPLHDAVEQGHIDVVRLLIKSGANISAITENGTTPVELAVQLEKEEVFNFLQEASKESRNQSELDLPPVN